MTAIIGRKIIRYEQVTSTNDLIHEWADLGEEEGLVIAAEEQTAGHGRLGRKWIAPPGTSLQLSILLRPPLNPQYAVRITQFAALALAATLRECVGAVSQRDSLRSRESPPLPGVSLKWPNDVLLNGKKCAGILVETSLEHERLASAILGIGLNVNFSMPAAAPKLAPFATTLADEVGHSVERGALQDALLAQLDAYYGRLRAGEDFSQEWRGQLSTLGQKVRVSTSSGVEEGIAEDVDMDGALLLRQGEQLLRFYAGDVTLLKD
jgi:BirA family transcriptional regulator, biotin operon repressor / biotin---[acetyl-CoA-carboxylase] ligase